MTNLIDTKLHDLGWSGGKRPSHSNATLYWWKRYPTYRCQCNSNKPGIQICIYFWESPSSVSFEIELCAEKIDNEWVSLKVYSISKDSFFDILEHQIDKLISAWEAMNR